MPRHGLSPAPIEVSDMHEELKRMREKHPDWIWNRSDTHVLLGVPQSLEALYDAVLRTASDLKLPNLSL